LQVNSATIEGAGYWYSQIKNQRVHRQHLGRLRPGQPQQFRDPRSTSAVHDDSTANAINGSLGIRLDQ